MRCLRRGKPRANPSPTTNATQRNGRRVTPETRGIASAHRAAATSLRVRLTREAFAAAVSYSDADRARHKARAELLGELIAEHERTAAAVEAVRPLTA